MEINGTVAFVYCIIATISALILFFISVLSYKTTNKYSSSKYIKFAHLFGGLAALFDCAYIIREAEVIHFSDASNYILTILYVIFASLTGTFWVIYSERKQKSWFAKTKRRFILYCLPLFLLLLFVAITPFTKWYFYFQDGHYERGPLFIPISVLLVLYILQTGVIALIKSFQKENYVERLEYRRLFVFAVVYLIIQAIQLVAPNVFPYRSVGTMLVFLVFLILNLYEKIGHDPLTHINNRFAAERHLDTLFTNKVEFEVCYLDIDKFKSINDTYGHLEGDNALRYLTNVLSSLATQGVFVSRMGGDEFIVINTNLDNSIKDIENTINKKIKQLLEENKTNYNFTVSVGYAYRDDSINSIPDIIALADSKLYERKASK